MIETAESRAEFEKRRERAKTAMRSALRGELPLDSNTNENEPVRQESVLGTTDQPSIPKEVPTSTSFLPSASKKKKFDKTLYQREYMRKRRAQK